MIAARAPLLPAFAELAGSVRMLNFASPSRWAPAVQRSLNYLPELRQSSAFAVSASIQSLALVRELLRSTVSMPLLPELQPPTPLESLDGLANDPLGLGMENSPLDNAIWAVKRTYKPSLVRRKRSHGFLTRLREKGGRKIIDRRRAKGRHRLSP